MKQGWVVLSLVQISVIVQENLKLTDKSMIAVSSIELRMGVY
jgi:hypothetical protein